jgi:uncharacterized protein YecT (DUF1311 family)
MRGAFLLLLFLATPAVALDAAQIKSACYADCEAETEGNPSYKACVARAADRADALLNNDFKRLQDDVRKQAEFMQARPDAQLGMLTEAQRKWIAYRDATCDFEDSLAFGATATGGIFSSCVCALSYGRIEDFERIRHSVLGR